MKNTEGTVKKKVCRAAVRHKDWVGRNEVALPRGRQHTQRRAGREQNPWKERYQSQSNGNPSQKSIKCFSGVSQQASSKEVLTDSVIIMPFGAVGSPWPDTWLDWPGNAEYQECSHCLASSIPCRRPARCRSRAGGRG